MATTVIFLAKGTNEFSLGVKDDDRIHHLSCLGPMLDVDQSLGVDRDPMGVLPLDVIWHLHVIVVNFVTVPLRADHLGLGTSLVGGTQDGRCGAGSEHGSRGSRLQENTAR